MITAELKKEEVRGWSVWAPRIATLIFVPVLLLGVAEGALRMLGIGYPTSLTVPCTMQGRPASCYNLKCAAPLQVARSAVHGTNYF